MDAVSAALEFNATLGGEALTIKIGLHAGSCIAVTMNDRLDYFCSAVNTAARLQGQSLGGDVVLSHSLALDPAVVTILADRSRKTELARLKGLAAHVLCDRLGVQDR